MTSLTNTGLLPLDCITVNGMPIPDRGVGYNIVYKDGDVLCSVEELVLRRAELKGWEGLHREGSVGNFRPKRALEDAIGSQACSLEANTRATTTARLSKIRCLSLLAP
jgi:hypothetical protein